MLSVLQPVCKWIQHLFVRTLMWVPTQPVLFFGRWPHGNFRSPFGKGRPSQICFYQVQLGNANFSGMVEIQIRICNRSVHFLLSQDTCKDSGTQLARKWSNWVRSWNQNGHLFWQHASDSFVWNQQHKMYVHTARSRWKRCCMQPQR